MKILRKNVDLDIETIAILQIEATIHGFGALKPYLEKILNDTAKKLAKGKPKLYSQIISKKLAESSKARKVKLHIK
jgi:hypothetical protein